MSQTNVARTTGGPELTAEWPELFPFDAELAGPPCPLEALPRVLRRQVEESAESIQVSPDMCVGVGLAVLATAAARRGRVLVGQSFQESLNLFECTIADVADRKTPAHRAMSFPLDDIQDQEIKGAAAKLAENKQSRAVAEQRLKKLQADAARAKSKADRDSLIREATQAEQDTPDELAPPVVYVDDTTPEALVRELSAQGGRLALISDEGGCFFGTASGRYERSGAPNLDAVLKCYDGGHIRVSRVTRSAITVKSPALTLGLMLQPSILDRIGEVPDLQGRGLLGRFIWIWADSLAGTRMHRDRRPAESARVAWADLVHRIWELRAPEDAHEAMALRIEGAALEVWIRYHDALELELRPGGRLHWIRGWAGKHAGRAARLAALFHLARHASGRSIPPAICTEDVEAAVKIAQWLTEHALAVFARIGADEDTMQCKVIARWLAEGEVERFTRRDLYRARYSERLKPEALQPWLEALEERGIIRRLPEPPRPKGGRPSFAYEVNPDLHARHRQNLQNRQNHSPGVGSVSSVSFVGRDEPGESCSTLGGDASPEPDLFAAEQAEIPDGPGWPIEEDRGDHSVAAEPESF